jgi:hypothetical protein
VGGAPSSGIGNGRRSRKRGGAVVVVGERGSGGLIRGLLCGCSWPPARRAARFF